MNKFLDKYKIILIIVGLLFLRAEISLAVVDSSQTVSNTEVEVTAPISELDSNETNKPSPVRRDVTKTQPVGSSLEVEQRKQDRENMQKELSEKRESLTQKRTELKSSVCEVRRQNFSRVKEISEISFRRIDKSNQRILSRLNKLKFYWEEKDLNTNELDTYTNSLEQKMGELVLGNTEYKKMLDVLINLDCNVDKPNDINMELLSMREKRLDLIELSIEIKDYLIKEVLPYIKSNNTK